MTKQKIFFKVFNVWRYSKTKFLLIGLYKSPSVSEKEFLLHLNKAHNFFSTKYENITLIGDFNMQPGNKNLKDFCDLNQLEHLILKPTCYKGKTPSTIDLIITNHKTSFMKSDTCETGLSDHHKMVYLFWRKTFAKGKSWKFSWNLSIHFG